jgi:hypothetical protein
MLHSSRPVFTTAVLLGAWLAPVSLWGADTDSHFKARRFQVESTPAGADVFVIGGKLGKTPLRLSERDIYPNWYPDDQAYLYGVVILRKAGCADYSKRLTLDDIGKGIQVQLDCSQDVAPAEHVPLAVHAQQAPPVSTVSGQSISTAIMQRRLRQLKVLQELLDDDFITEEEERTIRKRILNAP